MIWNGSLYNFSSLLVLFQVEILEVLACRAHFMGRSHFVDFRSRTFRGIFGGIYDIFGGVSAAHNFIMGLHVILHNETFPIVQKSPQMESVCKNMPHKLTYLLNHHAIEQIPCQIPFLTHVELVTCVTSIKFQKDQNPNPNWELGHAKTLKLTQYGYPTMLYIRSSREEGGFHSFDVLYFHS